MTNSGVAMGAVRHGRHFMGGGDKIEVIVIPKNKNREALKFLEPLYFLFLGITSILPRRQAP